MASGESILLGIENVSKTYGGRHVLKNVTLSVRQGEFLSIIGPSGSGKSTLLKIIAGVETPSNGSVILRGEDPRVSGGTDSGIVMVWQSLALFPHLSVGSNVAFGLFVRAVSRAERDKRVQLMLEKVGLSGCQARCVNELSGGEQQRVALARALILEPHVLLLDEPFGALDASLRAQLQTEIRRLHRSLNLTIIMVTHDQREALALSDRVAVLRAGGIEQINTPDELLDSPRTGFVARFLGNRNTFSGVVTNVSSSAVGIQTAAGAMTAVMAPWVREAIAPGVAVVCILEPHNVHIGTGSENTVKGTVELRTLRGMAEALDISVAHLGILRCEAYGRHDPIHNVGDNIDVCWSQSDCLILPE